MSQTQDDGLHRQWLELLVTYYPKPEATGRDLLQAWCSTKLTDAQTLQMYRLTADVGAIKSADDYHRDGPAGPGCGLSGRGRARAAEWASDANAFTEQGREGRNQRLLETAKKAAAVDQATLAKASRRRTPPPTGKNAGLGLALLGYSSTTRPSDISPASAKGGAKDEPTRGCCSGSRS